MHVEEVAVRPRPVAPGVGTALTAARWLRGFWCGSSEARVVLAGAFFLGLPSHAVAGAAAGTDCAWGRLSVMEGFGRMSSSTLPSSSRCSHLEIWILPSPSYLSVLLVFGCCLWSTSYWFRDACAAWFNSGYMLCGRLRTNFSIFYVAVNSNPEAFFFSPFGLNGEVCTVDVFGCSFSQRGTWKTGHYFYKSFISWQFAALLLLSALDDESSSSSRSLCKFVSVTVAALVICGHTHFAP